MPLNFANMFSIGFTAFVVAAVSDVPIKSESHPSNASKPSTPTNHPPILTIHDAKSQSDSENEAGKKLSTNEENEDVPIQNEEKPTENKMVHLFFVSPLNHLLVIYDHYLSY